MSIDLITVLRDRLAAIRADLTSELVARGHAAGLVETLADIATIIAALDGARGGSLARVLSEPTEAPLLPAPTHPAPPARASADDYDPIVDSLGSWRDGIAEMRCRHRRAAVRDDGGPGIGLILYGPTGAIGEVALDPARAVGLACELIAAAHLRMAR